MGTTWRRTALLHWGLPIFVGIAVVSAGVATTRHVRGARAVIVPGGTAIVGAVLGTVSSGRSRVGDVVALRTVAATPIDDDVVLPAGTAIYGEITRTRAGGMTGTPALTVQFTELELDGRRYVISTAPYRLRDTGDALASPGGQVVLAAGQRVGVLLTAPLAITPPGVQR